ncbi:MAG: c-type cytochrome [Methylocella sp.]
MKFLAGVVTALAVSALCAFLVIVSGAYNVAAVAPPTELERIILSSAMRYAVRAHAGKDTRETWSDDQVRQGFKDYDTMCVVCHGAPGKERSDIGKSLRPEPPNLAEASQQWSSAELFWIVKNGIRMTGMPAFGPTHQDEQIRNFVGFVRRLPQMSAEEFEAMEEQLGTSPEHGL